MESLKFHIDNMCANFTVDSVHNLVKARLAQGSCTMSDIASEIAQRDRSLDIASARTLAEAAVGALAQRGDVAVQGEQIYRGG